MCEAISPTVASFSFFKNFTISSRLLLATAFKSFSYCLIALLYHSNELDNRGDVERLKGIGDSD